jgi:hypothetical protein
VAKLPRAKITKLLGWVKAVGGRQRGIGRDGLDLVMCFCVVLRYELVRDFVIKMQSFRTPTTVPRPVAREKQLEISPHVVTKELFKRSLRQVKVQCRFKNYLTDSNIQLDVSAEDPEVICEKKLIFAPHNLQERIAGLAWQVRIQP